MTVCSLSRQMPSTCISAQRRGQRTYWLSAEIETSSRSLCSSLMIFSLPYASLRPGQQSEFIADSLNLFRSENRAFWRTALELENNGLLADLLLIIIAPDLHRHAQQFAQHPRRAFVPDGRDKTVSNQMSRLFKRKRFVTIRAEGGQD